MTDKEIRKVAENYHNWQQKGWEKSYKNIPEFCYSANFDEIKENDFSLVPSKYIPFIDRDSEINFDAEMKRIQKEFNNLLSHEVESQNDLIEAFKELGYEIKF